MNTSTLTSPRDVQSANQISKSKSTFRETLGAGVGGPLVGLVLIIALMSAIAPNFTNPKNLINIVDQVTVIGVLALGATAVIIIGGIDLSVGAVLAFSTMVLGWVSHDLGAPMWMAILIAIACGTAMGILNGVGVAIAKLPSFIATLAMMSIARGLANIFSDGQQIVGYPDWFFGLSSERYLGYFSLTATIFILLYAAGWIFFKYRTGGRALYAIGGNPEVARLAGLHVKKVTIWVYATAGTLAGIGGVMLASRLDSSQPSAGSGYELDVIAAVVIGGASLAGGKGRVTGTIIGVLIIGALRNGLNLLGTPSYVQQVIIGLVIAAAVMIDVLRRKKSA
ncbi:ABC transporter permease [Pseudarthrobacter oxydans]|uniref:ABC transporter permease n=1 Tax=Pseudarthrobacter oxydans TaxID=1671 RepID=UPI003D268E2A